MNPLSPNAKTGVVMVGEARGFVVEGEFDRFVITAAHCLPHLPPAAALPNNEPIIDYLPLWEITRPSRAQCLLIQFPTSQTRAAFNIAAYTLSVWGCPSSMSPGRLVGMILRCTTSILT